MLVSIGHVLVEIPFINYLSTRQSKSMASGTENNN